MAESFNAGSAYATIHPQLAKNWRQDLKAQVEDPKNDPKATVTVAPKLGLSQKFQQELRARMAKMSAHVIVEPKLGSTTTFKAELRTAVSKLSTTVKVDPKLGSTAELKRQLRTATANMPALKVGVDLDFTQARHQLAAFRAATPDLNLNLNLDTTAASAHMAALIAQAMALRGALNGINIPGGGGMGGMARSAGSIAGPAAAAAASLAALGAVNLIPLVAQLAQAAGVLALIPAGAAAAGASLATIAIGSTGIMDAFHAAGQAATSSGQAATSSAKQQRAAARQVEDAERAVADARENATWTAKDGARQIASAERQVQDAQKRSLDAQEDLTRARKDAQQQIEDLNFALRGSAIDEEDALIAVERARERLRDLGKDGQPVSTLDVREAQNGVQSALRRVDEVRKRNSDLREETDAANRAGVEGAQQVVDAREAAQEAAQGEIDAMVGLSETHAQVARNNAQAQRQVEDALRRVADAQESQAEAMTASAGGVDKFAEAMAKLSPNAQDFVTKVREMGDAWTEVRKQIQDSLFAGLGTAFQQLGDSYLPKLRIGLGGIATEINGGLKRAIEDLNSESAKLAWSTIFENTRRSIGPLIDGISSLMGAFTNIASVGSEFLPGITQGFADIMARFEEWSGSEEGSNWLRAFIQDSMDALQQVWDLVVALGRVIGSLFSQTEDQGGSMMQSMTDQLNRLADWMGSEEGRTAISEFFSDMRDTLNSILEVARLLGGAIGWVSDFLNTIGASDATAALGNDLRDIQEEIQIWQDRWNGFSEWWRTFWGGLEDRMFQFGESVRAKISDAWTAVQTKTSDAWNGVMSIFDSAKTKINDATGYISGLFDGMGSSIKSVWDGVVRNVKDAVRRIGELLQKVPTKIGPITVPGGQGARELGDRLVGWAQANAAGGLITGPGTGTSDSILSWLSNGEYVVKASQVAKPGVRTILEALNDGWVPDLSYMRSMLPAFATGGYVGEAGDRALSFARSKAGLPYVYGGAGGDSWDCSGYMSGIHNALTGQSIRYVTGSDFAALGYEPGFDPNGFSIGTDGGVGTGGHMAGTLFGINVESDGSNGVQFGGGADGALNFPMVWHLPRHLWNPPSMDDPYSESIQGLDYGNDGASGLDYSGGGSTPAAPQFSTTPPPTTSYNGPSNTSTTTANPPAAGKLSPAHDPQQVFRASADTFRGKLPGIAQQMIGGWLPDGLLSPGGLVGGLMSAGQELFNWYRNQAAGGANVAGGGVGGFDPGSVISGFLGGTGPQPIPAPYKAAPLSAVDQFVKNAPAPAAAGVSAGGDTYQFHVTNIDEAFRKYQQMQARKAAGFMSR
ncbi:hypothetical protein [Rhodococcus rhodochrous]|uniref:Uncharacterized protein n=1 Tax=Rhodococcus rhodochrous TaxID=1829 RepID=A0AA47A9M7_RHORH|nr:hypothetical protein [Rhodococcus rhodochrous]UZF43193.1 hypothetical protein KUM34_014865 [Rhodococcus rhodochrous]